MDNDLVWIVDKFRNQMVQVSEGTFKEKFQDGYCTMQDVFNIIGELQEQLIKLQRDNAHLLTELAANNIHVRGRK